MAGFVFVDAEICGVYLERVDNVKGKACQPSHTP